MLAAWSWGNFAGGLAGGFLAGAIIGVRLYRLGRRDQRQDREDP